MVLDGKLIPGLETGLTTFILAAFCWRRGWMGGGDVKLLGAVALGITPSLLPEFISAVALAGGALSLLYLAAKRFVPQPQYGAPPARLIRRILRIEGWRIHRGCPLPYACAIAAGTMYIHL